MTIDRERLTVMFGALGATLSRPATLCLIGSTPSILLGQGERQTQDIDVWHPASDYDAGELAVACGEAGLLFDPTNELDPDAVYLQIVRPGIVALPAAFEREQLARFGALTLLMPSPALIVAAKLTRGSERDIEDAIWWVQQRGLEDAALDAAIAELPRERDREAARENAVLVRLVTRSGP